MRKLMLLICLLGSPITALATGPDCYPSDDYNPAPKLTPPLSTSMSHDYNIKSYDLMSLNTTSNLGSFIKLNIEQKRRIKNKNKNFIFSFYPKKHELHLATSFLKEMKVLKLNESHPARLHLTTKKFADYDDYNCDYTGAIKFSCTYSIIITTMSNPGKVLDFKMHERSVDSEYACKDTFQSLINSSL